jgi:hypothetical protein
MGQNQTIPVFSLICIPISKKWNSWVIEWTSKQQTDSFDPEMTTILSNCDEGWFECSFCCSPECRSNPHLWSLGFLFSKSYRSGNTRR